MATQPLASTRSAEFFRHLDAKDEPYLREAWTDDAQGVDEITRGWLRGRAAMTEYVTANLPRLDEMQSHIEQLEDRHWGDVEVETFVLRQTYLLDGVAFEIEAPSTVVWRRVGDAWKVTLFHSVPLPASS